MQSYSAASVSNRAEIDPEDEEEVVNMGGGVGMGGIKNCQERVTFNLPFTYRNTAGSDTRSAWAGLQMQDRCHNNRWPTVRTHGRRMISYTVKFLTWIDPKTTPLSLIRFKTSKQLCWVRYKIMCK